MKNPFLTITDNESFLFDKLRKKEYKRLDDLGHTYLDYTGGNLYALSQLVQHQNLLTSNVLGNPHSTNPTSQLATKLVDAARKSVIDFFNADDYHCIFTKNASGALKIVGESYPFDKDSFYLLLSDNHNSVNGIREYCLRKGGSYEYSPIQYKDLMIDQEALKQALESKPTVKNKLFAFPGQSNVSGNKHDLKWINIAKKNGWDVLLDAAAFVPSSKLDLSMVQPDFVSVSFYKIFGYPTGLGCLLVKKTSFNKLNKPWFAGGTIKIASVRSNNYYLADGYERFEDGTINYLDIPAVKIGIDYINKIGMDNISKHIKKLSEILLSRLSELKHDNGLPMIKIFGSHDLNVKGGTFIINVFDINEKKYPFQFIEEKANNEKISIRSGCFCNPGIDEINNCLTDDELNQYFTSKNDGDYLGMVSYLGKMRGSTRISLGLSSAEKDINKFISFIKKFKNKAYVNS